MTTPHTAAHHTNAPGPADRDRRAWVAPLTATLLLLVLVPAALFLGGLSGMATDACGPADCSPALTTSLDWIYGILEYGFLLTLPAIVTAWALPRTRRWTGVRVCAALASLLPPVAVLLLVLTLPPP